MPAIKPRQVDLFCQALKMKLNAWQSGFAKHCLRHIVSEIRVTGKRAVVTGNVRHRSLLEEGIAMPQPDLARSAAKKQQKLVIKQKAQS